MSEVVIIAAAAKVARRYPASWLNAGPHVAGYDPCSDAVPPQPLRSVGYVT